MDVILTDKSANPRVSQGLKDNSYSQQNSYISPTNKQRISINQSLSRNIAPSHSYRSAVQLMPLQSLASNIETPIRALNSPAAVKINSFQNLITERTEEQTAKVVKHQPKITTNSNLPSVFISKKPHAIKIKKLVKRQKLGDISIEQDNSPELARRPNPNQMDRNSKPFLSPQRVVSSNMSLQNLCLVSKTPSNSQQDPAARPVNVRESARKIQFENLPLSENSVNDRNAINAVVTPSNTKKQIVILKRFLSKSPESNIPPVGPEKHSNFSNAIKFLDPYFAPSSKIQTKISLNEMITLKKIKTTQSNGILKRMLHVPSLNTYDLQEEPIKAQDNLKEWIGSWQKSFNKEDNKYLQKILTCFWNSPEGCVSILKQASSKGSLQDLFDYHVSLPESCIQQITINILRALHNIHNLIKQPYGAVLASEIVFDSSYQPKLSPGTSHRPMQSRTGGYQANIAAKEFEKVEEANRAPSLNKINSIDEHPKHLNLGLNSPAERTLSFSSDTFDLGYLLLTCALGNLDLFDTSGFYSLENMKSLIDQLPGYRRQIKNFCCVLHSEEELRRCYCELSPTRKLQEIGQKPPLMNNFHSKSPTSQGSNHSGNKKIPAHFTLLDLLKKNKRHSDVFIDFLCNCLKIDGHSRPEAISLLDHKFVSDNHLTSGPLMNLSELMSTNKKEYTLEISSKLNEEHLNRVCEAIKIVIVNNQIKEKMTRFTTQSIYENQQSREYQKISALAMEIGVPISSLIEKFRNEIFRNELIH